MPVATSVRGHLPVIVVAACLIGCGPGAREPDDQTEWLRAGLSDRGPWMGVYTVVQWGFDDDGTVTATTFSTAGACGNDTRTTQYLWRAASNGELEVTDLDGGPMNEGGGGSWDRAVFRLNPESCAQSDEVQTVDWLLFKDGEQITRSGLVRGKVCLEETAPCQSGVECDGCRTMWCDGEPPEPYPCDG